MKRIGPTDGLAPWGPINRKFRFRGSPAGLGAINFCVQAIGHPIPAVMWVTVAVELLPYHQAVSRDRSNRRLSWPLSYLTSTDHPLALRDREGYLGLTAKAVDDKSPLRSARPRRHGRRWPNSSPTGTEIGSRDPLYRLKLILNVPHWIRDFLVYQERVASSCRLPTIPSIAEGRAGSEAQRPPERGRVHASKSHR
jgi:hypothetical protein